MLRALASMPPRGNGRGSLPTALSRALDPAQERPRLRPEVEVAHFRTRWGERYAIVHSPSPRAYLRFEGDEIDVLIACDGGRSVGQMIIDGFDAGGPLDIERVAGLVLLLRRRGFLDRPYRDAYVAVRQRLLSRRARVRAAMWRTVLKPTITIPRADGFTGRVYRAGARFLFTPIAVAMTGLILCAGLAAFVVVARSGGHNLVGNVSPAAAAALFGLGLGVLFVHEISHALAVRHAGRRVVGAGFQLYLGHPAFFIDSTDLMLAPPRARAVNAAAGPYAEAVAAGVASLVALALPGGASALLFRFAALAYLNVLLNLIPFLELDGYWLLSDILDVPRLRPRSFAVLRYDLPERLRRRRGPLSRQERRLAIFGAAGVLFTVAAVVTAWTFWVPIAAALVTALWQAGALGQVVLFLLLVLVVGPLANGAFRAGLLATRRLRRWGGDLRFRMQTPWRIEAARAIAALPLLAGLDEAVLADLAGRVTRRRARAGESVIREGTAADSFLVVRNGTLVVTERAANGSDRALRRLDRGSALGELALLERRPRTATVRALTRSELFVVDAGTFGRLIAPHVRSAALGDYQRSLLDMWSLPPFRAATADEATAIAARGHWTGHAAGDVVVRQGDAGDRFYVVAAGQCEVVRDGRRVAVLHAGDHFGELALLNAEPRTATVRTLTPARLFSLDAAAFSSLVAGSFARGNAETAAREHDAAAAH